MKLHLPKALCAAVIAACAAMPSYSTTGWLSDYYGYAYYTEIQNMESIDATTVDNTSYYIVADSAAYTAWTLETLSVKTGDDIKLIANPWDSTSSWRSFASLAIDTLSVENSGAATLSVWGSNTISIDNVEGSLAVSTRAGYDYDSPNNGTLTIGSVSGVLTVTGNTGTMTIGTSETTTTFGGKISNSGSMTVYGAVAVESLDNLTCKLAEDAIPTDTNGFASGVATFTLADAGVDFINATSVAYGNTTYELSSNTDGETIFTADDITYTDKSKYYINTGTETAGSDETAGAGSFVIASGATLSLGSLTGTDAGAYIASATGAGTIETTGNTTIAGGSVSEFAGTVVVADNTTLQVGNAELTSVTLDKATIQLGTGTTLLNHGSDTTIGTVELSGDATIKHYDAGANKGFRIETLIQNDHALTITNSWNGTLTIGSVDAGTGSLSITKGSEALAITIESVESIGSVSITGQSVTLGAESTSTVNLGGTVTLLSGSSLTINGAIAATSSGTYELAAAAAGATYSDVDNGFMTTTGSSYYLVKFNGSSNVTLTDGNYSFTYDGAAAELTTSDTGVVFTGGETTSAEYWVRKGDVSEQSLIDAGTCDASTVYVLSEADDSTASFTAAGSISNNRLSYVSGSLVVTEGNSLTIDTAGSDVSALISATSGAGNIEINTTATVAAGSTIGIGGNLIVNSGGLLQLAGDGFDGGVTDNTTVNGGKISSLVLNGGTAKYRGSSLNIENLTVQSGSSGSVFGVYDLASSNEKITISNLTLNAGLQIQPTWKSVIDIGALTGSGELQFLAGGTADTQTVTMGVTTTYTGQLNLDGGDNMTVNINVEAGATAKIKADNASTIDKLVLGAGSALEYVTNHGAYTYTLNEVEVSGEARIAYAATERFWQGLLNIEELTNAEGVDGELTLQSNAKTTNRSVMNINGGEFSGKIIIDGATDSGSGRKFAVNIKNADVAANAEIALTASGGSGNVVALGIAADEVKVKGISGSTGTIYSGEQAYGTADAHSADGVSRKLTINTQGSDFSTSAAVVGSFDITKQGDGKQTFSGDVRGLTAGTVAVEAGTLAVTSELAVASLSVSSGAVMQTATVTASEATLAGGATVDGNLTMADNSTLTVGSSAFTVTGTLAFGTGTSLDLSAVNVTEGTTSYTLGTMADISGLDNVALKNVTDMAGYTYSVQAVAQSDVLALAEDSGTTASGYSLVLVYTADTPATELTQMTVTGASSYTDGVLTLTTDVESASSLNFASEVNALISDSVWRSILAQYELDSAISVSFTDADGNAITLTEVETLMLNGDNGYYTDSEKALITGSATGSVASWYTTSYIPEPSTATLSLLALAALAARRRRK